MPVSFFRESTRTPPPALAVVYIPRDSRAQRATSCYFIARDSVDTRPAISRSSARGGKPELEAHAEPIERLSPLTPRKQGPGARSDIAARISYRLTVTRVSSLQRRSCRVCSPTSLIRTSRARRSLRRRTASAHRRDPGNRRRIPAGNAFRNGTCRRLIEHSPGRVPFLSFPPRAGQLQPSKIAVYYHKDPRPPARQGNSIRGAHLLHPRRAAPRRRGCIETHSRTYGHAREHVNGTCHRWFFESHLSAKALSLSLSLSLSLPFTRRCYQARPRNLCLSTYAPLCTTRPRRETTTTAELELLDPARADEATLSNTAALHERARINTATCISGRLLARHAPAGSRILLH